MSASLELPGERTTAGMQATGRPRIGELLLERRLITEAQLEGALVLQRQTGRRVGETLVELGALSSHDLTQVLAEWFGFEFVDLAGISIDWILAQQIPEEIAHRYQVLPITARDGALVVAMANPEDVFALDDVTLLAKAIVVPVMAEPGQLARAIERAWNRSEVENSLDDARTDLATADELSDGGETTDDGPIVRFVNAVIDQAIQERASDIHIEPGSTQLRIRMRVDGVLHDASEAPAAMRRAVASRLKVMAGIDIANTRTPHDGRFSITVRDRQMDVRVATLPTAHGEAVVLRLLDRSTGLIPLENLGFRPEELERYEAAFAVPSGTIISSGPTGSGKTSTLYSTLARLNTPDRSIITVEDPIEYRVDRLKQIQINPRAGLTFPTALRSILRADPDVVLVGEVRDAETARMAAETALTGHLVLTTIHANRAAAVPLRLMDMGVEPFLVVSSLTCIVGQRLVRKLCERCAEPHIPDAATRRALGLSDAEVDETGIRRGVGCTHCNGSGYRGRIGVYEILPITEDISRLIIARASSRELERWAISEGFDTLRMSALKHVLAGRISIEEMLRVIV